MYFLVPLIPPVSSRPWALIPWSQAVSIQSWIWKMDGRVPCMYPWPLALVCITYEDNIWMFR